MPRPPILSGALFAMVTIGIASVAVADQGRHREQDAALAARRAGQAMSLHEVEQRIVPRMQGSDYLGPEYDAGSGSYRLKFMRDGALIWVDVDARTGAIIGRSGD